MRKWAITAIWIASVQQEMYLVQHRLYSLKYGRGGWVKIHTWNMNISWCETDSLLVFEAKKSNAMLYVSTPTVGFYILMRKPDYFFFFFEHPSVYLLLFGILSQNVEITKIDKTKVLYFRNSPLSFSSKKWRKIVVPDTEIHRLLMFSLKIVIKRMKMKNLHSVFLLW